MAINIEALSNMPAFISIRKSSLKELGGNLDSMYEVPRWDGAGESRARHGHNSHKDHCEHTVTRARNARRQIRALMGRD